MTKYILFVLTLVTSTFGYARVATSSHHDHSFAAGILLGAPSAIIGRYNLDSTHAIDGGLGFAMDSYFMVFGDYVLEFPGAFGRGQQFLSQLTPFVGVGGLIASTTSKRSDNDGFLGKKSGDFGLGVRVPVGIEWRPSHPTLGVFIELVPGLAVAPATTGFFQGGIGVRYYF